MDTVENALIGVHQTITVSAQIDGVIIILVAVVVIVSIIRLNCMGIEEDWQRVAILFPRLKPRTSTNERAI